MNRRKNMDALNERITVLTRERETAKGILDSAVEALGFSVAVDDDFSEENLLKECAEKIRNFVHFNALAFFLFSSDGLEYFPSFTDPSYDLPFFEKEMALLVEDRTFAWTIDRNRPVIVTASDGKNKILLHSIITQNRTMGIFMGLLGEDESGILDLSFAFLTVLFSSLAGILQNAELYSLVQNLNSELSHKVRGLEESERNLATAMRARDLFLANVSHEIRTPLNGILGMAALLDDTEITARQRSMIKILRDESASLLRLVSDLLDFSKMEAGKLSFEDAPFSLREVWESVGESFSPRAKQKELDFAMILEGAVPEKVSGDSHRLRQVLGNLIGNGLKFTRRGGIFVDGRILEEGAESILLSVNVRDTGIGISSEKGAELFQPFVQGDASTTRKYGGTGLGLVISKRLVEGMGGTISFESAEGKGATFTFTLPLKKIALPAKASQNKEDIGKCDRWKEDLSVLVVDDNATSRLVALSMLKKLGVFSVETAENGAEALEKLAAGRYDLVLMDIQMPVMDGVETVRRLRGPSSPALNPQVPVAAMTANILPSDRERYLEAGMEGYIAKPILPEALRDLLCSIFSSEEAPPPAKTGEEEPQERAVFRREVLLERMGQDEELCCKALHLFLSDSEKILHELEGATKDLKTEEIITKAHLLRGASANVEAREMMLLSDEIEKAALRGDREAAEKSLAELRGAKERFAAEIDRAMGLPVKNLDEQEGGTNEDPDC